MALIKITAKTGTHDFSGFQLNEKRNGHIVNVTF